VSHPVRQFWPFCPNVENGEWFYLGAGRILSKPFPCRADCEAEIKARSTKTRKRAVELSAEQRGAVKERAHRRRERLGVAV